MINLDLTLSQYQEKPTILPSGLRSYRHTSTFKQPEPKSLFGDLELLASLNPAIDLKELQRLDKDRKAGVYLRDKLKGVRLSQYEARILATLIEEDSDWHHRRKKPVDLTNIEEHGTRYRVQVKQDGKTKKLSFPTLEDAIRCRDRHTV